MEGVQKICRSLFKFFASLKLAVVVILSFAYVLALGTIYESLYGTPVAKEKVYGTFWFSFLMLLLGINVLSAALSRLPWKKHHMGFVVTHAGIITILIGSFITQKYGINGTMALAQGEMGDKVVGEENLLQIALPDWGRVETWKANFKEKSNNWEKSLKDGSKLIVDRYFPHAETNLRVTPVNSPKVSDEGEGVRGEANPALKVTLSHLPFSADSLSEWVFKKESPLVPKSVQVGPAKISFVDFLDLEKLSAGVSRADHSEEIGKVELSLPDGKKVEFSAGQALREEVSLEGTHFKVKGIRYLPDAVVRENKLLTRSENPNNPAYEFEVRGPQMQETHLVFARFPDLEAVHGRQEKSGIKALYKLEEGMRALGQAELYLALLPSSTLSPRGRGQGEGKELFYRIRSKQGLSKIQTTKVGENHPTGWMSIQFQVEEYIPRALADLQFRNVKVASQAKEAPPPAIHVMIKKDEKSVEAWLQQGDMKVLSLEGNPYVLRYGLKSYPLGFQVRLDKFQVLHYPGTESPSAFESFVTVANEKAAEKFDAKIYMNSPLHYKGYTFYQSSYQENPGQPTISIFSVANDPGSLVKYGGSILLVSGIALMFWFKPLFVKKKMEARKLAQKA